MVYESLIIRKIKKKLAIQPSFGWLIIFAISAWLIDRLISAFLVFASTNPEDATGILLISMLLGAMVIMISLMILN
jgi:biotin transporter BioY